MTRLEKIDVEALSRLLRRLQRTDVDELEVTSPGIRLYLRRVPRAQTTSPLTLVTDPDDEVDADAGQITITAPLTGVFYARPAPDQPPFLSPGDLVEAGQVVGLIETMKLFNEVISEVAGEVLEVPVAEGELVEVGQVLVRMRPLEQEIE